MNVEDKATAKVRLLTVREYHRMFEAVTIQPEEKVELIAGQIWQRAAKGAEHSAAVTRCDRVLRKILGDLVLVRLQDPIQLDDYSEPEPDIAIVKPEPNDYEAKHPTAADVYLLVEVADTTLRRDLDIKASLYAQAGILEYWVLDINNCQIYVFRNPNPQGYQSNFLLKEEDRISLVAFSDLEIGVAELFQSQVNLL